MILTKDLDNARYQYGASERVLGDAIKELEKALSHLKQTKILYKKGFVKLGTYQSYKATTANLRTLLVNQLVKAKANRHEKWKIYDNLQKEYAKQNPSNTLLQDTLSKLDQKQKEVLKEYFLNLI